MQPLAAPSSDQRLTPADWRVFWARLLHAAALGSLGAGAVFFVAANWQAWGLAGRFGLLEAALLICVAAALWQPPPARLGQGALLLATLLTGALLALFGQSYQTGADTFELFFAWSLLALPFALAASSGAVWAAWWVVLDVGLALLCSQPSAGPFDTLFPDRSAAGRAAYLMLSCLANLLGAAVVIALRRTRVAEAAPPWLAHVLLTVGLAYATVAALPDLSADAAAVIALYAVISVGIGVATWLRRQDVFPLTAVAGSLIVTSTTWLAHAMRLGDIGELFVLALWLVVSSSVSAMLLMRWLRQWRAADDAGAAG